MTYAARLDVLRLIAIMREMDTSTAACSCGRHYRLLFDPRVKALLEQVEATVIGDEPALPAEAERFSLLDFDD